MKGRTVKKTCPIRTGDRRGRSKTSRSPIKSTNEMEMTNIETKSKARITAIGTYVPEKILTNFDLERLLDTSDEWIIQRTGIKERRIAKPDEYTSDLSFAAVKDLAVRYNKSLHDVDLVIVCTVTPDHGFPSVASQIQSRFGMEQAGTMDLNAACAGFTYGLHVANGLVTSNLHKKVLVIATDTSSKVTNYNDRTTCILFGDGAGAVLVERDEESPSFLSAHLGTDGEKGVHLYRSGLSNRIGEHQLTGDGCIVQNGREVYKWAVFNVTRGMQSVVEKAGKNLEEVDWFVPHSANLRMIESICEKTGFPLEKTIHSIEHYGNTEAASIPLALDIGIRTKRIKNGDSLLMYGFGAGLTFAGLLIQWNPTQ